MTLNGLGDSESVSDQLEKSVIQLLCYSGKKDESYVDTRVRLYKNMKVKSSSTLPPGPKSFNKHIRRVNFQLYEWVRFDTKIIPERIINGNGRKQGEEDGKIIPVWYEGRWVLFDVHVDDHFEEN